MKRENTGQVEDYKSSSKHCSLPTRVQKLGCCLDDSTGRFSTKLGGNLHSPSFTGLLSIELVAGYHGGTLSFHFIGGFHCQIISAPSFVVLVVTKSEERLVILGVIRKPVHPVL